jgi:methionine-rich copper-binding protein CopC
MASQEISQGTSETKSSHPDGNEHWMGVGLKPGLPDGTYTGAYRVISADTHIVYGGLVFNIGHAMRPGRK